jgi:tRNA (guanine-N7-)-methyltransferase
MTKKKLQRFAEMETFTNVVQPEFKEVFGTDYYLKGQWNRLQFGNSNPLVLELGCGKGEYTVGLARLFPQRNFIGIDIKGSRIWRGAKTALEESLSNVKFLRTHIEQVNSFFACGEVDEIWITFPDPQLKKKRKRLTSSKFLMYYVRFLKPNGMIHLKTDNHVLYRYTKKLVQLNNFSIRHQTDDLYGSGLSSQLPDITTYYERQFLAQGMTIHYLCFELPHEKTITEPADE